MLIPNKSFDAICAHAIETIRNKCDTIATFAQRRGGAIRITAVPHNQAAAMWLHPACIGGECRIREEVYPVFPGGSFNITTEDGELVNCYSYSSMKAAYCMALVATGKALFSCPDENLNEELREKAQTYAEDCGFARRYGSLCIRVYSRSDPKVIGPHDQPYLDIYITVSGATQVEDVTCAHAAVSVFRDTFRDNCDDYDIAYATLSDISSY